MHLAASGNHLQRPTSRQAATAHAIKLDYGPLQITNTIKTFSRIFCTDTIWDGMLHLASPQPARYDPSEIAHQLDNFYARFNPAKKGQVRTEQDSD